MHAAAAIAVRKGRVSDHQSLMGIAQHGTAHGALIAVGLGIMIWPGIVSPPANLSHMASVVRAVLGAVSLLALLGLRYPLKMLPLLFFEVGWKVIWVLAFGLPLWLNNRLDAGTSDTLFNCLVGIVLVPIAIPWGYTFQRYFKAAGERWSNAAARAAGIR